MNLKCILCSILAAVSFAAYCQPANPFLGKWKVTWNGAKRVWEAKLIINATGGSWQQLSSFHLDTCSGKEAPIAIESSSDKTMTIKLKYSVALAGCPDSEVTLQQVDEKTFTGKRGKVDMVLSRE